MEVLAAEQWDSQVARVLATKSRDSLTLNASCHNPLPAVEQQSSPQLLVSKSCCCGMPLRSSDVRRSLHGAAPPWPLWNCPVECVQSKTECDLPPCALWEMSPTPAHLPPAGHCSASPEPTCQQGALVSFVL